MNSNGRQGKKPRDIPGSINCSATMWMTCLLNGYEMRMEIRSNLRESKNSESIDGNIWHCIVIVNGLLQGGETLYYYKDPETAALALANQRISQWRSCGRNVFVKTWKVEGNH